MDIDQEVNIEDGTEMAHCALINFDNVAKMNPGLGGHPIWMLARHQLIDALQKLGREVE